MNNKNVKKAISERCDEIKGILQIMRRANSSGDDVRIEIDSGLNLLAVITGDLEDLASQKVA